MIIDLRDKRQRSHSIKRLTGHEVGQQSGISLIMAFDQATYPQLKSLLSTLIQSHAAEWIFVDMGTSPAVQDTLCSIAEETNQVVLLQTEKMSLTEAWQLGADKAKGEYLLFLDSHFALTANALSQALDAVSRINQPGPWLAGFFVKEGEQKILPSVAIEDPKTALKKLLCGHTQRPTGITRSYSLEPMLVPALEPHALLLKRSDYWAIGGIDTRLTAWFAASDLALKTHCHGGQVYCFSEVYVLPVKPLSKPPTWPHILSCIRYYQKHYRKSASLWIRYSMYAVFSIRTCLSGWKKQGVPFIQKIRSAFKKSKK
jgi:hypothetical protein